jgi:hypothetical protein
MSNNYEYIMIDEFKAGLYAYSNDSGLSFMSSLLTINTTVVRITTDEFRHLTPPKDKVYLWLNYPI